MRVYIIGNDGITLCRTAPAAVNNGEIAVASNKELHAAPLSAKRLLALWNALPGVEKRRKVGDRDALIEPLTLRGALRAGLRLRVRQHFDCRPQLIGGSNSRPTWTGEAAWPCLPQAPPIERDQPGARARSVAGAPTTRN